MQKKPTLVILAAGKVTAKLPFLSSLSTCPALVPLGTKSSLLHQIHFYEKKVSKIIILTNSEHVSEIYNEIFPELLKKNKGFFKIFGCKTKNVNKTLQFFCNNFSIKNTNSYIFNLSTSIPSAFLKRTSFAIDKKKLIQQNWSSIIFKKQKISKIFYRKNLDKKLSNAFIGIFRIEGNKIKKIVKNLKTDDQIELIEAYVNNYKNVDLNFQEWLDIGHSANYFQTKKKLIVSRNFNKIKLNNFSGTITKISKNLLKLKNENLYIKKIPNELKVFFPRIINNKSFNKLSYLEMEYCAYPTLTETSLFWNIDKGEWKKCFELLTNILKKFKKHKYFFSKEAYINFYYYRLIDRVNKYFNTLDKEYKKLFLNNTIRINNKKLNGYSDLIKKIPKRIEKIYNKEDFCIMHGDFCFNNILYEPYTSTLKLIDPRGSFNTSKNSIYGDQKYDFAKLSHSAVHYYDYLIAGKYNYSKDKNSFNYNFLEKENYKLISDECNKQIRASGYKIKDIEFLVGILFLSMTPLHNEDKLRQKVMFLHGISILNKSV